MPSGSRRWAAKRPLAANALRPRARTKTARTRFARIDRVTATNAGSRRFEWRKRARCFSFRHPVALRRSSDSPPHGHSTPPQGTPEALKKAFSFAHPRPMLPARDRRMREFSNPSSPNKGLHPRTGCKNSDSPPPDVTPAPSLTARSAPRGKAHSQSFYRFPFRQNPY